MTKVRTNDGRVIEIQLALIQDCSVLKMATDCSDEHTSFDEVPLPNIDAAIMETVVRFFETGSIPEFQDPRDLFTLYDAANFLGYNKLQDSIAKGIAENIKSRSEKEIHNIFGIEKELLDALKGNGFASDNVTLEYVYSNTLQDGQYTAFARQNAQILAKYLEKYGKMTIREIRNM